MEKIPRHAFVQKPGAFALTPLARTEPDFTLYKGNLWTVDASADFSGRKATLSGLAEGRGFTGWGKTSWHRHYQHHHLIPLSAPPSPPRG